MKSTETEEATQPVEVRPEIEVEAEVEAEPIRGVEPEAPEADKAPSVEAEPAPSVEAEQAPEAAPAPEAEPIRGVEPEAFEGEPAPEAEQASEAEPAPSVEVEAEQASEAEPAPSVEAEPNAAGSPELAPGSYVPVGEPPLGLSSALAVEFGRAIEASWALAEVEQADSSQEPESAEEPAAPYDDASELQVRLARVHLRTGALALARVELEKLAGRGSLDQASMLDLAEVRWRTGDLAGAGIAASAYLDGGGGEALGFVIAAEACAAADRPAEARRHAGRALERSHVGLETYFAGIPRRLTWPQEGGLSAELPTPMLRRQAADTDEARLPDRADLKPAPEHLEASAARWEAPTSAPVSRTSPTVSDLAPTPAESKAPAVEPQLGLQAELTPTPAVEPQLGLQAQLTPAPAVEPPPEPPAEPTLAAAVEPPAEPPTEPFASASSAAVAAAHDLAAAPSRERETQTEAAVEVDLGIAALQSQDLLMAGLHFGIAIRLTPSSATGVLEAIGDRHELPLELVRGDALRLLGQHGAADEAYLSVAAELRAPAKTTSPIAEEAPTEPLPDPPVVVQPADEATGGEMPAARVEPASEPETEPAPAAEPAPEPTPAPAPVPAAEAEPAPEPAPSGAPEGPGPQEPPDPPSIQWH